MSGGRPFKDLAEGRTLGRLASWGRRPFKDLDEGRTPGKTLSGSRSFQGSYHGRLIAARDHLLVGTPIL